MTGLDTVMARFVVCLATNMAFYGEKDKLLV